MSGIPTDHEPCPRQILSQLMDGEWHGIDPARCVAAVCADERLKADWARWHAVRHALRGEGALAGSPSLAARIGAAVAEEPAYTNVTPWPLVPGRVADLAAEPAASPGARVGLPAGFAPPGDVAAAPIVDAGTGGHRGARVSRLGLTGFALAASAALVTVVGLNAWQGGGTGAPPVAGGTSDASFAATGGDAVGTGDAPVAASRTGPVDVAAGGVAGGPSGGPSGGHATPSVAGLRIADALAPRSPAPSLPVVELVSNPDPAGAGSYWVAEDAGIRRGAAEARLNAFLSRHIESAPTAAQQGLLPYSRLVGYDQPRAAEASAER